MNAKTKQAHRQSNTLSALAVTFAAAARDFTHDSIARRTVHLVFEKSKPVDRYGRLLACLYRETDGFILNRELVAVGYAHVEVRWPFQYMDDFRELERDAREQARGLRGVEPAPRPQ